MWTAHLALSAHDFGESLPTIKAAHGMASRKSGSQQTRCWRKTDSNHRSPGHEKREIASSWVFGQTAGTVAGAGA